MKLPCLPLIEERFVRAVKEHLAKDMKYYPDIEMYMFPQMWGSTALGFGGIGGQAMTTAYTTVVADVGYQWYGVFFGEGLAYLVSDPNDAFFEDLRRGRMESCARCRLYDKEQEGQR